MLLVVVLFIVNLKITTYEKVNDHTVADRVLLDSICHGNAASGYYAQTAGHHKKTSG